MGLSPYEALAVVIAVVAAVCLLPRLLARLHVWRRCRCGRQYCTGCGKEK